VIALVTGASSGIGEATALRLARRGWDVVAGVRREEDAERLRRQGLRSVLLDVTDPDAIAALDLSRLDGLVNNAGVALALPLELLPLDELRRLLEVNLVGQLAVTQRLLPALRAARGRIVNVGSIAGRSALPFLGAYAASKFALEAASDALRVELRPWGIRVAIVEPGSIATPIWTKGAQRFEQLAPDLGPYRERLEAFRSVVVTRTEKRAPADEVARAVEHALTASRPRARYLVGRDARTRAQLERLPTALRDRVLARVLLGE
jgi:NAD(P)-dependent dehydrogenase (short-subunit alcohol dehydrogenase family)